MAKAKEAKDLGDGNEVIDLLDKEDNERTNPNQG
ncbi:hypothetical protein LCGC14_0941710 [marine sediment metagenome]|uniref:Uncharacterized protein n=1 Tax=marine sediment metagenome TaxID=412755 RepID=A0A0F9NJZ1_9ZZZZ